MMPAHDENVGREKQEKSEGTEGGKLRAQIRFPLNWQTPPHPPCKEVLHREWKMDDKYILDVYVYEGEVPKGTCGFSTSSVSGEMLTT
jgi:hypothetical protein